MIWRIFMEPIIRVRILLQIVVSASGVFDEDWVSTDIDNLNLLKPAHWRSYFQKNSIDAILE